MNEFIENLVERFRDCTTIEDYGELFVSLDEVENIVNELAEEYIPCTKHCTDCEAYDLVKHNCPKFCKVIKETVEELAEEYNNGWIACSSGNFSTSEVLVFKEDGTIDFDVFDFMDEDWKFNSKHHKNKVIAWMPLPQPYTVPPTEQPTWKQKTMNRFERVE